MTPANFLLTTRPGHWILMLSIMALLFPAARAAPEDAFATALADLRRAYDDSKVLGTTIEAAVGVRAKFFAAVAVESLGPREIAELVRLNAFRFSDAGAARAKVAAGRLKDAAAVPDADGALAATLRVLLSAETGLSGEDRAAAIDAAIHHPAYGPLLQGDYGDLAVMAACRAGLRGERHRETVMGLPAKLDASRSVAAADAVREYWAKVVQGIPAGEQRERLRRQLADYVAAVVARPGGGLSPESRTRAEDTLAHLNSPAARGDSLVGRPAPELNFLWSSEGGWQTLSELRGQVVVLDFWATWCGACLESFPRVARLAARYRGTDVRVIGVTSLQGAIHGLGSRAIDCRADPGKEMRLMPDFMKAKNMTWPVVISRERMINPDYGVDGIPHVVVVAPDGTVRFEASGLPDEGPVIARIDAVLREFSLPVPSAPPAD